MQKSKKHIEKTNDMNTTGSILVKLDFRHSTLIIAPSSRCNICGEDALRFFSLVGRTQATSRLPRQGFTLQSELWNWKPPKWVKTRHLT